MRTHESRRQFLSSQILAVAGLAGISAQGQKPTGQKTLRRTLGKTGIQVPIVSMGVMNTSAQGLIRKAYEVGVRHFDTSAAYFNGQSEEALGAVIKELGVRKDVILATKALYPAQRQGMSAAQAKQAFTSIFQKSLKRLKTDYVDILYFHDLSTAEDVTHPGVTEAMAELRKQGMARFLGVSSHIGQAVVLKEVARTGFYDVALIAFNFTMSDNHELLTAIRTATSAGIGLIAMKTQGGGPWYQNTVDPDERYQQRINQTGALKWVLGHPEIATTVPGFADYAHVDEDFSVAFGISMTEEEKNFLKDRKLRASIGFCQQCGHCVPGCPSAVHIPSLMRAHMYAIGYGNAQQARFTLAGLGHGRGLDACSNCDTCRASCQNKLRIASRVADLKRLFG
jgi:predicted aldo/keto reductase-like oxidoreductase